jgi:hypothetical protein
VGALHDLAARAEEEERAGAVRALGLALFQALVAHERALLVTDESANGHARERPCGDLTVDLGR